MKKQNVILGIIFGIKFIILLIVWSYIFISLFAFFVGGRRPHVCPCPGMTKWEGKDCTLYIMETIKTKEGWFRATPPGVLVCRDVDKKEYIYDVMFVYDRLYLYNHREKTDDVVEQVATYHFKYASIDNKKVKYILESQTYADDYFPETLKLKETVEYFNIDNLPYKYLYGDPTKFPNKEWVDSYYDVKIKLHISDDGTTGALVCVDKSMGEETEYKVTFNSEQIMTVYDKHTDEKIVSYYVFFLSDEHFYAIMEEKFDENCMWEEYIVLHKTKHNR